MRIVRLTPGDGDLVLAAADLFDASPTEAWTARFLSGAGHHLLIAVDDHDDSIGFVSGVETTHPDKGTEMFLYELSVHPGHRNRGVGRALVGALAELARGRGCYGMWVSTESDKRRRTRHLSRRWRRASRTMRHSQLDVRFTAVETEGAPRCAPSG